MLNGPMIRMTPTNSPQTTLRKFWPSICVLGRVKSLPLAMIFTSTFTPVKHHLNVRAQKSSLAPHPFLVIPPRWSNHQNEIVFPTHKPFDQNLIFLLLFYHLNFIVFLLHHRPSQCKCRPYFSAISTTV